MKFLVAAGALVLALPLMLLVGVSILIAPGAASSAACLYTPAGQPSTSGAAPGRSPGSSQTGGGQAGTGLKLGVLPTVHASPGAPYTGRVRLAAANLPTGHKGAGSLSTVPGSLRAITTQRPDFIALNEVSRATGRFLTRHAPGYGAYKDPVKGRGSGNRNGNSIANAVMWDTHAWALVDGGRFMYVEHDLVIFKGKARDWNRYATWTVLQHRSTGRQVVVIATHHMTNPEKQKRTHRNYRWPSRVAQYEHGMVLLRRLIQHLAPYGPVLLAGDMNVFPRQGAWSAPDQLAKDGFGYTRDKAVIYQFFPTTAALLGRRLVPVSSDHPHALITTLRLGGRSQAGAASPSPALPQVPGLSADQVRNAAAIMAAGSRLGVPPRGITIGLMTAYGESRLRNLDHGDRDSVGLFQQRDNGAWGTTTDRMTPATAATNFFNALMRVSRWQQMTPTLAAHTVQVNADPGYYAPFWKLAQQLYAALHDTSVLPSGQPGQGSPNCLAAGSVTTTGTSGSSFTTSGIRYVGPFAPRVLMARAQAFVAARTVDPYFGTVNGSWYRQCQHFAANLSGRPNSGFPTAALGWAHFVATDAAHPAAAADGHAPPIGAWLYYQGTSAAGHVAVYLGHGLIATTDLPVTGAIGIVPASAPTTEWNQTYLGWATPWAAPGTGSN